MLRPLYLTTLLFATVFGCLALAPSSQVLAADGVQSQTQCGCAQCRARYSGQPDLFYNYYAAPNCGGVPAQMYLAPRPVPASVGHTYYTYQPFMPHEMLYRHKKVYHRFYNDGRGLTRTRIRYW